jgi:2-polyprenyl-6-methoxyphenol hydroxylase-like FAD-dependent oxidoreductase
VNRPRALVIGGSLSGLFTANLLRTIGWDVEVFERARGDLTGRGAVLGAQDDLFAVMRRIGIPIDKSMWTQVRSHICLDQGGKMICRVPVREATTAWDRVYRALKQALPMEHYHGGMMLSRCEQADHRVVATFANGACAEADLLIAADGMRSTVRRELMPEIAPRYAGYVAWWRKVKSRLIGGGRHSRRWRSACPTASWHFRSRWQPRTINKRFADALSCGSGLPNTIPLCGGGVRMRAVSATATRYRRL